MDLCLLVIKYIFKKNEKENVDTTLDQFFSNGTSFPMFISILYGIDQIPGFVFSGADKNNTQALNYLSQKNGIFIDYQIDFHNKEDQQKLIELILSKEYFKTNIQSFLKKVNDYLQPFSLGITDFSEFIHVNGFMKLLNAFSNNFFPSEIKADNNEDLIDKLINYLSLSNVPVIIDKTAFLQSNQDFLLYQALLILEHFESSQKKVLFSSSLNSNISLSCDVFKSSEIIGIPKSSYINIFNDFMENHFLKGVTFFSDFEQGKVLPKFVGVLLEKKVPDIIENPIGYDQLINNMNSLYFIKSQYQSFNPRNFNIHDQNDIIDLIRILLKKFVFTQKYVAQMKIQCNKILQKYHIEIRNFNKDWNDGINFVALLNFISKNEIEFPPSKKLDIDDLKNMFKKANCKSILEDDSIFGDVDEFVIIYQVKIMLDKVIELKIEIPDLSFELSNGNEIEQNDNDLNPIIRFLNVIGKDIGLYFDSIDKIIDDDILSSLVSYLIENSNEIEIKQKIAQKELNINFLKENFDEFQLISLDFNDKLERNENIINFAKLLLKKFYIKDNETKLLEKVSELIGETILIQNINKVFKFGNGFYKILGNNMKTKYYDEECLLAVFRNKKIPFILDEESLTNIDDDYIFLQLQLIFDHLEKNQIQKNNIEKAITQEKQYELSDDNKINVDKINEEEEEINTYEEDDEIEISNGDNDDDDDDDDDDETNEYDKINDSETEEINDEVINVDYKELHHKIKSRFKKIFKTLDNFYKDKKFVSIEKKYNNNNELKAFHLYKFKFGIWQLNEQAWREFISINGIKIDDILYWILLPPICTQNPNSNLRDNLIKTISASAQLNRPENSDDAYVEICYCNKITDLHKNFGINTILNKNEKIVFIQIRYSPSLEYNSVIENMQAALTLHADYVLAIYKELNLESSVKYINNSISKAKLSLYFKQKSIGFGQLFMNLPIKFNSENKKMMHDPEFQKYFTEMLNNDEKVFNIVKKCYKNIKIKMQWVDELDFETYNNFLETVMSFCQNHTSVQNIVKKQISYFKNVCKINQIKDENIENIMNEIIKIEKVQLSLPLFNFNQRKQKNQIIINNKIWDSFLLSNQIDKNAKSLIIILFIYSNPRDMNLVSKTFSKTSINDANSSDELLAQIKYCDVISSIANRFNMKNEINSNILNNHLAFICIKTPKKKKDLFNFLQFAASIAFHCQSVIAISSKPSLKKQISCFLKLKNLVEFINMQRKDENEYCKGYFYVNESFDELDQKEIHEINIQFSQINSLLNLYKISSCTMFLEQIFSSITVSTKSKCKNQSFFSNIKIMDYFLMILMQNISVNPFDIQDQDKLIKNVVKYFMEENNEKYSSAFINKYFLRLSTNYSFPEKIFNELMKLKKMIIYQYACKVAKKYITVIRNSINKNFGQKEFDEYLGITKFFNNSICFISIDQIEYFKESCDEKFKDFVMDKIVESISEDKKISKDLYNNILSKCLDLLANKKNRIYEYINKFNNSIQKIEKEEIVFDDKKIQQNSMKYVLSIRESIQELTVEIDCDENLEKEIPLDY